MKETVLRILHSATAKEKDPFQGVYKRNGECIFHCAVRDVETLLQEDINCGHVTSLRIRQLSNPPPEINPRDSYKTVTKLELSCPIEVSWVFSVSSILPSLNIVRFGSSCFESPFGDCSPLSQTWIAKSRSVNELIISFDHRKLLQEEFDKKKAIQSLNSILEYSTKYFICLAKADIYVPFGVHLDEFLRNNPLLAATGEMNEIFKLGTNRFQSFAYSDKSRRIPELLRRDSNSSGSEPTSIPLPSPQLRGKRTRSDTTDLSSEADEDWEDSPLPSKLGTYVTPSSPPPKVNHNNHRPAPANHHHHHAPVTIMPEYSAAYYRRSGDDHEDRSNHHHKNSHQDRNRDTNTSTSPKMAPTGYSDFSQMYTRRGQ